MMCLFLSISLHFSANTLIQHRVAPLLVLWGTYATFSPAGPYNLQDNIEMGISGHQMYNWSASVLSQGIYSNFHLLSQDIQRQPCNKRSANGSMFAAFHLAFQSPDTGYATTQATTNLAVNPTAV